MFILTINNYNKLLEFRRGKFKRFDKKVEELNLTW
jgi:hypothetical protein